MIVLPAAEKHPADIRRQSEQKQQRERGEENRKREVTYQERSREEQRGAEGSTEEQRGAQRSAEIRLSAAAEVRSGTGCSSDCAPAGGAEMKSSGANH